MGTELKIGLLIAIAVLAAIALPLAWVSFLLDGDTSKYQKLWSRAYFGVSGSLVLYTLLVTLDTYLGANEAAERIRLPGVGFIPPGVALMIIGYGGILSYLPYMTLVILALRTPGRYSLQVRSWYRTVGCGIAALSFGIAYVY